jgi:branched-subunit amino acid transport protein
MDLSPFEFIALLLGLVLVVTGMRVLFLYLPARWRPRGAFERALRYAPLAALVALTVPQVFASLLGGDASAGASAAPGGLSLLLADGRVPSAVALLAVGAITRKPLAALATGVAVLMLF